MISNVINNLKSTDLFSKNRPCTHFQSFPGRQSINPCFIIIQGFIKWYNVTELQMVNYILACSLFTKHMKNKQPFMLAIIIQCVYDTVNCPKVGPFLADLWWCKDKTFIRFLCYNPHNANMSKQYLMWFLCDNDWPLNSLERDYISFKLLLQVQLDWSSKQRFKVYNKYIYCNFNTAT